MLPPEFFVLWSRELKFLALRLIDLPSDTLDPRITLIGSSRGEREDLFVLLECYLELRIATRANETLVQLKVNDASQNQLRSFAFLEVLEISISYSDKPDLLPI